MSKWQPIETAPSDKTKVLLWDGYSYVIGWHEDHYTIAAWITGYNDESGEARLADDPTHWMPLPEPPE